MPVGENFWNPYRMVPVRNEPLLLKAPVTHEKFTGLSGYISCSLEALTPFLIGRRTERTDIEFIKRNGKPVIPGTSLKGMIRALAEIVGNGCAVIGEVDDLHRPCVNTRNLCVTCRMFGMMERGREAKVFMGKVTIGDGIFIDEVPRYGEFKVLMGTPNPRHTPFYINPLNNNNDKMVRKFYFHQPAHIQSPQSPSNNLITRAWTIKALMPPARFKFTVTFNNLLDEELDLLLYCLFLENDFEFKERDSSQTQLLKGRLFRHKLGYGKPLGMGSVFIQPDLMVFRDMKARYSNGEAEKTFIDDKLTEEIRRRTQQYRNDESPTMEHLRKMLIWDIDDRREFKYPPFDWFRDIYQNDKPPHPENSKKSLKKI